MNNLLQLSLTFVLFLLSSPQIVYSASNLQTAADSGFSNQTTNFSPGQTIFVKVAADNNGGSKHELNLKDNKYNQVASYSLWANGSEFATNFSAPQNEGYYSLEARIEAGTSQQTSVKTIKIGDPGNSASNVNVNVSTKVEGLNTTARSTSQAVKSPSPEVSPESSLQNPSPSSSPSPVDISLSQEQSHNQELNNNLLASVGDFFKKLWDSIWPFD